MIKKIITTLIIIITCISILVPTVKATTTDEVITPEDREKFEQLGESDQVEITSSEGKTQVVGLGRLGQSGISTIVNGLAKTLSVIPMLLNKLMEVVAYEESLTAEILSKIKIFGTTEEHLFTIESLLTGEYPLFDIDLFTKSSSGPNMTLSNSIKNQAAIWYTAIRNLAIVGCLVVAIYVGIRLAIATTADDTAKYKKMLTSWVIGIILLFSIHYIVLIMIKVSNIFINFIKTAIEVDTGTTSMEQVVLTNVFGNINKAEGWNKLYYVLLYAVLTYYELKFFIMYLFRVFKIFVMMVISPLVCMTYPIDTLGDGRAQGFNNWFREIMIQIFLQPIHLLIYVIFIYSAGEIAKVAPLIAVIFIIALDNGEKIIRSALKIQGKGLRDINFIRKGKK